MLFQAPSSVPPPLQSVRVRKTKAASSTKPSKVPARSTRSSKKISASHPTAASKRKSGAKAAKPNVSNPKHKARVKQEDGSPPPHTDLQASLACGISPHRLPNSMIFVDDNVLDGFPPVENGKRSTKPRSPLESLSLGLCRSRRIARWDLFLALWERMHWIVESSVNIWLAETYLASKNPDKIDEKFTELWLKLKRYLHDRNQRSDLLRLAMKELGDTIVEAVNHKIDDQPAPLLDTEPRALAELVAQYTRAPPI
ncbi:hypothetical protein ON010_g14988 [Phytophthora cinnamomi]|nr:hypothetical protein ON010_g14988 [Phytophthora cinnamomi]